ncbi:TonB-dependent receptor domain-containing protein [Campylobacter geochelonis]|uniref:Ribosome-binding factor A n=1 Tax=Campylobacter geochelonis TaxID=1780362 RepID=A0A128EAA7_9BACT|nr:TonB-dependent receptor [Campylobacter geochelonis]QKF72119.1 TonB-dependent receptor [Campylobacter geochelonis]CZE45936.1 ribosome-binding factor A [Campylobacter geochelonis]CZE46696.1 ribosome-binding factor A [Campylobacter geochelonis]CZE49795.1 ribosome-binding factor A [Campylobacter geochelonis]
MRFKPYLALSLIASAAIADESIKLENIVVTASGYEQNILEAPATIQTITKEEIEDRAYANITDVLDDVAGVSIEGGANSKTSGGSIYIRGLSEEYTMFLVDGKAQGSSQVYYNGYGSGAESNWLPPADAIERIEVIKGPMSSLYGSEAMGGVINVITKKIPTKPSLRLTYDTMLQEKSAAGNSNNFKYYMATPIIDDVLGISLYGQFFDRDEDKITDGYKKQIKNNHTAKVNLKIGDSQDIEFLAGYARTKNRGHKEKSGYNSVMDNDRRNYSLTHNIEWNEKINTTSFINHENVHIHNGSANSGYLRTTYNTKSVAVFDTNVLTFGAEYKKEQTKHAKSRFHGTQGSMDLKRWQGALFLEDEYFLTDEFYLTGGLRWDENEHYGSEIIPRLYGVYKLSDSLSLKAGVSKGYKAPTLKQADPAIGEQSKGGGVDLGNKSLSPETSINYEVGLAYDDSALSGDLTAFYTDFQDKINKVRICDKLGGCHYNDQIWNYINEYQNVDKAELKGVEFNIGYKFDKVRTKFNYTYSKSEQKSGANKGQPFTNTPAHMANISVDYSPISTLNLWSKVKYKSATRESVSRGRSVKTPDYTLVDLGVKYKVAKNFDLFAGVYNVFNKEIDQEDGYGKHLDGRRYNLGFSVNY